MCSATEREHLLRESERRRANVDAAVDVRLRYIDELGGVLQRRRTGYDPHRHLRRAPVRPIEHRLVRCAQRQATMSLGSGLSSGLGSTGLGSTGRGVGGSGFCGGAEQR